MTTPLFESDAESIIASLHARLSLQQTPSLRPLDAGKAPKLLDSPEWGDMIAWQHDFSDFAVSNRCGDALTYDGTPEQQRNLYQCLSTATRACLAANTVVRRELPMHARRGEPQEFTSHGTKA
jgi:hypothetical protein